MEENNLDGPMSESPVREATAKELLYGVVTTASSAGSIGAATTTTPYPYAGSGGGSTIPSPLYELADKGEWKDVYQSPPREVGYKEMVSRVLNQLAKTISADLKKNYQLMPRVEKNTLSLELIDDRGVSICLIRNTLPVPSGNYTDVYLEMGIADILEILMMKGIMTVLDEAGLKPQDL
jgi:hypothetical protein